MSAEQWYSAAQVATMLGISRAAFYRITWFHTRKRYPSPGRVCYAASDVATYQQQHSRKAA